MFVENKIVTITIIIHNNYYDPRLQFMGVEIL